MLPDNAYVRAVIQAQDTAPATNQDPFSTLTERQKTVVGLLYELDSTKAIANRLGLSQITVKSHLTKIFTKMGVASRTQAAVKWELHSRGIKA